MNDFARCPRCGSVLPLIGPEAGCPRCEAQSRPASAAHDAAPARAPTPAPVNVGGRAAAVVGLYLVALIGVVAAIVWLVPASPEPPNQRGLELFEKGDLDAAIVEYRKALEADPEFAPAHNNLALALASQGQLDAAVKEYQEALRLQPDLAEAHNNYGLALAGLRKFDAAIVEYREAIRLQPNDAKAHLNLGTALYDRGTLDEAVIEYRAAIRLDPGTATAHGHLGLALVDQQKFDEAIAEYHDAIRLEPNDAKLHNNLGLALFRMGKLDEAIAEYHTALNIEPNFATAHGNFGLALVGQQKFDEAIAEYQEAIRLDPKGPKLRNNLGLALYRMGKLDEAIAEYHTALKLDPNLAAAHNNAGLVLARQQKFQEAGAEFLAAVQARPGDALAHCNAGLMLQEQGLFKQALDELRRGHELGLKQPGWSHPSAAWVRRVENMASLEKRLPAVERGDVRPKTAPEWIEFAYFAHQTKRYRAAARFFDEAFQADPKLAEDLRLPHRYNAACSAALAGAGKGAFPSQPAEADKARLRAQARDWLADNLKQMEQWAQKPAPNARSEVVGGLQHWKADPDLIAVRDPEALKPLPGPERKACEALWAEVDQLLKRLEKPAGKTLPTAPPQG